jgi:glycolate oxidase FAD binding subunit
MSPAAVDVAARLADLVPRESLSTVRLPDRDELVQVAARDASGFSAVLAWAARERQAVLVLGGGSRLGELNRHGRVDLVLSTRSYAGVVVYEPGDGTLTARAGSTWAELAAAVDAGGHRLAPDVPRPTETTLGGVLAAGAAGLDRLRYGPARHQVLGTRVALADGSLTKSGGALVKNVTGYDLHRLYTGSWGTLGVILEASLRLQPRPEREAVVAACFEERASALAAARAIGALPVKPLAVLVRGSGTAHELVLCLAGRADVLRYETDALTERLPAARILEGESAIELRRALRDRPERGAHGRPMLELALLPSRLEGALAALERAAVGLGETPELVLQPLLATIEVALARADELDAARLLAFQDALLATGARLHWRAAPRALRELGPSFDVFGRAPRAIDWMRRLRSALDPQGVFAHGGFVGGL